MPYPVTLGSFPSPDTSGRRSSAEESIAAAMRAVHGDYTERLRAVLQEATGATTVSLVALDDATWREFRAHLIDPAHLATFGSHQPQAGVLAYARGMAPQLVEHLLGYDGELVSQDRPLSDIEHQVLADTTTALLSAYSQTWQPHLRVAMRLEDGIPTWREDEPLHVATYRVRTARADGLIHVALRLATWREGWLATHEQAPLPSSPAAPLAQNGLLDAIGDCRLTARVLLGSAHVTLHDLLTLRTGDIVCLDRRADDPLEIRIGNQPKLLGRANVQGTRYQITVEGAIARGNDDASR